MKKNVIVAQSGGPSPVINASLQGVLEACLDYPERLGSVYAGWHGIEGVLQEELIDMTQQDRHEIALLRHTPAAGAIGTCRYKLKDEQSEDYGRILEVMQAHNVGYFFYIGGNDSMDTAAKVSKLAREKGFELIVTGVPKTIDNDIGDDTFTLIDHTPGYGSAARYWASIVQNTNEENRGMSVSEPVAVLQAMGRSSGYIPAASRLADPNRDMPLQLYMAESDHNLESLAENVNRQLERDGRCLVVVSEGFDVGALGEARDGFGHIEYGASRSTVAQIVVNYLNDVGLKARGQATGQVPGVLQRSTSIYASQVDIDEAYQIGRNAVEIGMNDGSDWMATILRDWTSETYAPYYAKVELENVANSVRQLPARWLSKDGLDVSDEFIRYAGPLIGDSWPEITIENGLQRFARLRMTCIDKKLPAYIPQRFRTA
ncbi:6-phosphofructokinase [candidate division KSB3 bacterium]|uniref:Pyrophosphate--fructose 6-phosphate 1-phosphotransferase n=1 Tax=candidate division KSB3 bacterium TaxID=2044937 RepID=A0A2G6E918_9BACT|nr:MAG: 6-phosphofructokinase [candidate division KSB3 bacterium]PIE30573.1 MAG: 6-phosphofructokinase [candidate division KSB3 bacterium]